MNYEGVAGLISCQNLHDFVYSDEFVAANTNNDVFQEATPTTTDGNQPSSSIAALVQINIFILFAVVLAL